MIEIEIKKEDRLLNIINKILISDGSELKIKISSDSILFKNILNIKIFQRVLDSSGKIAKIETESEVGKTMLASVRSNQEEADFSKYKESLKENKEEKLIENSQKKSSFEFPKISLPSFNALNLKMIPVFVAGILLVFGLGYYFLVYKLSVNLEILVSAERFVKSFEIKLSSLKNTDITEKVIRAESVSAVFQATKEISTTGKVDGGKKAEGEIKFLNKTDKVIKLDKSTKLSFKDSGKEYFFILDDSVEVPARTLTSTAPETFVSGEKVESATASAFGSSYNLAAGKSISIGGYSPSELSALVSASFEGGVKNTLNAVSETDIKEVSSQSFEDFKSNFIFNSSASKMVLKNSESFSIASQKFSANLTEASDKVLVTQDVVVSYIVYDYEEVLSFVKSSIKSLMPSGYELYVKDIQIELNSLGSTTGVSYDNKEANVQLTVKSYKIPVVDEEDIKSKVSGKKLSEVSQLLEDLDVNFNIESSSGLLNLFGFPKDSSNINVTVTKQ
jgi:hypothetical protein